MPNQTGQIVSKRLGHFALDTGKINPKRFQKPRLPSLPPSMCILSCCLYSLRVRKPSGLRATSEAMRNSLLNRQQQQKTDGPKGPKRGKNNGTADGVVWPLGFFFRSFFFQTVI